MRAFLLFVIALIFPACSSTAKPAAPSPFPFLNPVLTLSPELKISELQPFNHKLHAFVAQRKAAKDIEEMSLIFRDLESGAIKGVDFDLKFTPASLLKVPMLIAALKQAEKDPSFLKKRIVLGIPPREMAYLSVPVLVPGQEYSVEEIVRAMAVSSDNGAFLALKQNVDPAEQGAVYRDFAMVIPDVRTLDDSMSVREYSSFFRVLYNSSYLERAGSQKALELLSQADFKAGLVAGVPPGVPVAHKYGERFLDDGPRKQLHDCGVVYRPDHHYILCVMTRGTDFAKLAGVIKDVSALVYAEVAAGEAR